MPERGASPRSVTEFSPGKVLYQHVSIYLHAGMFICPRSVTESSLGDGNFFFSTTTYGGAYVVVVCLFVMFVTNFFCLSA